MLSATASIDVIAHDAPTDEIVLVIRAGEPWDGTDEQLFQLQEKLNTYVSFILDGEMAETYPLFVGKKARLQIDSMSMPDERTLELLQTVHDQLALQEIRFVLRLPAEPQSSFSNESCGSGCQCHS